MISQQSKLKSRKLQMCDFEVKEIIESSQIRYQIGFSYEPFARTQDFLKPYLSQKDEELYSFQLKRNPNNQIQTQSNKQGRQFIALEYIEGRFLDEIDLISSETFIEIFFQLAKALFELHKKNTLARCISTKNIFLNQFTIKIYLLEFGFYPNLLFQMNQQYKPEIDVTLLIQIMKDLNQIPKSNRTEKIDQIMTKINTLESQMHNLNTIQIYQRLYELVQGGPTQKEIQELYTKEWMDIMDEKICQVDFQSLIKCQQVDSQVQKLEEDEDEDEDENLDPPFIMNRFEFVKKALEIFEKHFPQEISQIGLMLNLLNYLIEQSEIQNKQVQQEEINERQLQILDKMRQEEVEVNLQAFIESQIIKVINLKDFLKLYRMKTYETYKQLFRSKEASKTQKKGQLKYLKISFMMVATLKINSKDFDEEQYSNIYYTKKKLDIQNKTNEIINSFYKNQKRN